MKSIKILLFSFCISSFLFAQSFEGVVSQQLSSNISGTVDIKWHIKNDKIALEITNDGTQYVFVPKGNSILMYSNEASPYDGKYYYSEINTAQLQSKLPQFEAEKEELSRVINNYKTKSIAVRGEVSGMVYYSNEFTTVNLSNYFKDYYELQALSIAGVSGIPLTAKLEGKEGAFSKLTTLSIEKTEIKDAIFQAPSGYINLPIGKQ